MPKAREIYTSEFKHQAVQLVKTTGKSCAEVARDLGVPAHYVVRWRQQHEKQAQAGRSAFTGRGNAALSAQEARLGALERELDVTRQERDILKKALACLGQNSTRMGLGRFFATQP